MPGDYVHIGAEEDAVAHRRLRTAGFVCACPTLLRRCWPAQFQSYGLLCVLCPYLNVKPIALPSQATTTTPK